MVHLSSGIHVCRKGCDEAQALPPRRQNHSGRATLPSPHQVAIDLFSPTLISDFLQLDCTASLHPMHFSVLEIPPSFVSDLKSIGRQSDQTDKEKRHWGCTKKQRKAKWPSDVATQKSKGRTDGPAIEAKKLVSISLYCCRPRPKRVKLTQATALPGDGCFVLSLLAVPLREVQVVLNIWLTRFSCSAILAQTKFLFNGSFGVTHICHPPSNLWLWTNRTCNSGRRKIDLSGQVAWNTQIKIKFRAARPWFCTR